MDSPNVTHPVYRYWLHYLVVNSKGFKGMKKADVMADYVGPWPQKGTGM